MPDRPIAHNEAQQLPSLGRRSKAGRVGIDASSTGAASRSSLCERQAIRRAIVPVLRQMAMGTLCPSEPSRSPRAIRTPSFSHGAGTHKQCGRCSRLFVAGATAFAPSPRRAPSARPRSQHRAVAGTAPLALDAHS